MPKPEVERQKSILNVLQGMQGMEPLKKLFWIKNFVRAKKPGAKTGASLKTAPFRAHKGIASGDFP